MKAWQRWQDAQAMLQKKREVEAKLLWANKPDKLQLAKEEIAEVKRAKINTVQMTQTRPRFDVLFSRFTIV